MIAKILVVAFVGLMAFILLVGALLAVLRAARKAFPIPGEVALGSPASNHLTPAEASSLRALLESRRAQLRSRQVLLTDAQEIAQLDAMLARIDTQLQALGRGPAGTLVVDPDATPRTPSPTLS